jgi:hypothetical protein
VLTMKARESFWTSRMTTETVVPHAAPQQRYKAAWRDAPMV